MPGPSVEYLTTKEVADLLRIKERKVYELAASGAIPCSRAMGKLLFPRQAVTAWLADRSSGLVPAAQVERPRVFLGSHDPLLEWALRDSQAGLATFFDGSLDGVERFAQREGVGTGLHVFDPETDAWNVPLVEARFAREPVVLIEWAWRDRGLIISPDAEGRINGIADLKGKRVVARQAEAGSQRLLEHLLGQAGLAGGAIEFTLITRTETDAALAVLEDKADAAFGLLALARQFRLGFVPVVRERFDLLVDRRSWFEEPLQTLMAFCRSPPFSVRARELGGYDISGLGRVRFNGS